MILLPMKFLVILASYLLTSLHASLQWNLPSCRSTRKVVSLREIIYFCKIQKIIIPAKSMSKLNCIVFRVKKSMNLS